MEVAAFAGFTPPQENWSKLPNQLIEAMPLIETIAEMKVILYVLRHTWGFKDDEKTITIEEFENGRKRKDGSRLDNGTGLARNSVRDGIKRAMEHGFIQVVTDASDPARIKNTYSLCVGGQSLPPVSMPCDLDGQSLTGGGQSLPLRGAEVDPRSEKETLERNLEEETFKSMGDSPQAAEQEMNSHNEPDETTKPDTPACLLLFSKLEKEYKSNNRLPPKKFPSLACKQKYVEAAGRLNGTLEKAIDTGLQNGILAIARLVNYVASPKWAEEKPGGNTHGRTNYAPAGSSGKSDPTQRLTADQYATAQRVMAERQRKRDGHVS